MKKNGLAVCYDTKNFGSQLQVFATIKKIEQLGFQPEIIKYKKKISFKFITQTIPRFFNPFFVGNKIRKIKKSREINKRLTIKSQIDLRNQKFNEFIKNYFDVYLQEYTGWESLINEAGVKYDGYLCGSDQLWLPSNLGSHFYTLEFVRDSKIKISYATSFGVKRIPWYQKRATTKYLNRFDALSTRELSGREIIYERIQKKIDVVCDPTLLMTTDEWDTVISSKAILDKPYIFCYFLGDNENHRLIFIIAKKVAKDVWFI